MTPPPRRVERDRAPRGQGSRLRGQLLSAARRVLEETGDDTEVTARNVAAAAGVAVSSIYLHFASIDELRYELAYVEFGEHLRGVLHPMGDSPPSQRIRARGRAIMTFAFEYPGLYRMLFMDEAVADRFHGLRDIRDTNLGPMIAELEAYGDDCSGSRADPEVAACLLWMGVHGLASLLVTLPEFPWPRREALVEAMLDLLQTLHPAPDQP